MTKRILSFSTAIVLAFTALCGRIGYIIFSGDFTVSDSYNSYSVTVDVNEPQLYYFDVSKINNNVKSYRAVIRPVTNDLSAINKVYSESEVAEITAELSEGYPVVKEINTNDTTLKTFDVYSTDTSLKQLIGRESSGVLSHIDLTDNALKISYHIDAKGRLLSGDEGTVNDISYYSREGYVLSIDSKLQDIAENASRNIRNGCVVIMEPKTSRIKACVTKPATSYINKAFEQYAVGSVFKIVVAACALENGIDFDYECNGYVTVGDTTYSCQHNHNHGALNLEKALAYSCNCYFVNLALELGEEKLIRTAEAFGFGTSIELFNGWNISSSNLPSENDLQSKGELALLGFGQGKLTASPLQMCSVLCTISNEGKYKKPELIVAKKARNGSLSEYKNTNEKQAVSPDTAKTLLKYLRTVVTDGTGYNAETSEHKSAGKTATAQTGQYLYGNELYNTWFVGVYPYDKPKYCIAVMCENGTSGAADCCPVFRTIVENVEK